MRSIDGVIDTTVFAQELNGGGHKQASGFRLPAKNIQVALKTVLKVIKNNYSKALKSA
jgi:nanoRNase/pAp phosphatase (c-di-AMP/oligoRNAs hydrolase)